LTKLESARYGSSLNGLALQAYPVPISFNGLGLRASQPSILRISTAEPGGPPHTARPWPADRRHIELLVLSPFEPAVHAPYTARQRRQSDTSCSARNFRQVALSFCSAAESN